MHKVFIDGQAGTTGLRIHEYLAPRADITLLEIAEADRKNDAAKHDLIREADVVILCLPDDAAARTVKLAANTNTRIIDASTAHRVHPDWTYGLPELTREQREGIHAARHVSNPGCYPTGFLLGVRPLVDAGIIPADMHLTISAISGYTGGGRQMVERYEERKRTHPDDLWHVRPYALGMAHKHLPEMQRFAGLEHQPLFLPSVGHFPQGMLVSVPLPFAALSGAASIGDLGARLAEAYQDEPCVTVHAPGDDSVLEQGQLSPLGNTGTNRVDLFVFGSSEQAVVIARLDNLGKGAGGAAVQNLNIMLGLDELSGLALSET